MSNDSNLPAPMRPVHVFVSYAREDRRWLDETYQFQLVPFLIDSLRRQNVSFWFDKRLQAGDEFKPEIDAAIDQSQIALLLVSQWFLNSEFIETREMPRIIQRAANGQIIVMPVLVEPCDWSDYPLLADRQMVPIDPLIDYTESPAKLARVRNQILEGLKAQVKRTRQGWADEQGLRETQSSADSGTERVSEHNRQQAEQGQRVAEIEKKWASGANVVPRQLESVVSDARQEAEMKAILLGVTILALLIYIVTRIFGG